MNKNKDIVRIAVFSALASLINLSLGNGSDQRVSLGIVAMIIFLSRDKTLPIIRTSLVTGLLVFFTRLLVFSTRGSISTDLVVSYAIEIVFYLAYAFAYKLLVMETESVYKSPLILLLILSDFFANTLEYFLRFFVYNKEVTTQSFWFLFLAALLRSFIIVLLYDYEDEDKAINGDSKLALEVRLSENILRSADRILASKKEAANDEIKSEALEIKKDAEALLGSLKDRR